MWDIYNYLHGAIWWTLKEPGFQVSVLEKTLESPLDSKQIKPVNPKGNHPWLFIGRTDAEALILWLPNAKSQLTGKYPDAGKDWRVEGKGATEDEMVGWHHWFNEHEFEQTPGDGEGQGGLAYCSPCSHKELDTTEELNNNNKNLSSSNAIPTSLPGRFKLSHQSPWIKAHWNAKCFLGFLSLQFCLH